MGPRQARLASCVAASPTLSDAVLTGAVRARGGEGAAWAQDGSTESQRLAAGRGCKPARRNLLHHDAPSGAGPREGQGWRGSLQKRVWTPLMFWCT